MNREEKVLSVGYLVKSPTRSKDKSNLPMFWKLRWCVFAKITYSDTFGYIEDTKLLLSYYEDKKAYLSHEAAKGSLNITNCSDIRSCYKSHAGFDHLFCIEWSDGKYVKFSAQSCQKKFKWVTVLYDSKNDTVLKGVRRSEVISGDNARKQRSNKVNKRRSECFENLRSENLDLELRQVSQSLSNLEDLGTTVGDVTNQGSTQNGQPKVNQISSPSSCRSMPLPPLPDERAEEQSMFGYHDDTKSCKDIKDSQTKSRTFGGRGRSNGSIQRKDRRAATFTGSEKSIQCHNDYDNLFMLCERCQVEGNKKKNSLNRRLSSKKRGQLSRDEDAGCAVKENEASKEEPQDGNVLSGDSVSFDELMHSDNNNIYVDIDDDWLERVKLLMSKMHFIGDSGDLDDDGFDSNNDYDHNDADNDDDDNLAGATTENKDDVDYFDGDGDNDYGDRNICGDNGDGNNKDKIKIPCDNGDNVDGAGDNDANLYPEDGIYVKMNIFTFAPSIPVPQAVNLVTENPIPLSNNAAHLPPEVAHVPSEVTPVPPEVAPVPSGVTSVPSGVTPVPSTVIPVPSEVTLVPSTVTPVPSTVTPVPSIVTPVPAEITPVPQEVIPVPPEVTPVPSEVTHVPTKEILLNHDTIPVLKGANILPKDVASVSPKLTPVAREIPLMNQDTGPSTADVHRFPKDEGLLPTETHLMSQDASSPSNKRLLASRRRQQLFVDGSPLYRSEIRLSRTSTADGQCERTVDPGLGDLFDSIDTIL